MPAGSSSGEPLDQRLAGEIPSLRAFLRRLCSRSGKPAEADDLVQDVLARALRSRHTFDVSRELGPWLRRTALRAYIDHCTRYERDVRTLAAAPSEAPAAAHAELDEQDSLECLLARLEPIERDALLRFHQRSQSIREIAGALGMPEGTVKSLLARARRKLAADRRNAEEGA